MERGHIWWANLPAPAGYEQGLQRLLLIVSSDDFNHSRIPTVQAVALSTNLKLIQAPGNVLLPRSETHLSKDTVVNVAHLVTVNKECLTTHVCSLSSRSIKKVGSGLRIALDL
jgi:mRNA interferase MazF